MRTNVLFLSLLAPGLIAAAALENIQLYEEGEFSSGFLIPANISLEDYDISGDWMTPVAALHKRNTFDLELGNFSAVEGLVTSADDDEESDIASRQTRQTNVLVGKTQVDYGCDASIRKTLGEAIHSLCWNGLCDGGTLYTRKVKHLDRGPFRDAWIQVRIEGHYDGPNTRGYIANVVENLVTPKTAIPAWREYHHMSQHNYYTHACSMSKFANYVAIHKRFSPNPVDIRINISLHTSNQYCAGADIFREVLGAVNGYAAAFFNIFVPSCA
ncbi:hypothetical protein EsH8_V_000964 [Colletotrichum jinshuiense]